MLPILLVFILGVWFFRAHPPTDWFGTIVSARNEPQQRKAGRWLFEKKDLADLIDSKAVFSSPGGKFGFPYSGEMFSAETTLDADFQGFVNEKIRGARSPLICFVAMEPTSGQIFSMVDHRTNEAFRDTGSIGIFPAASIFKIITACAAIEHGKLSADSTLTYNGRSHTLYKNQLKNNTNRYTNSLSLKDSFAKSINPAFGKLGIYVLKNDALTRYADRFGFNRPIDFELPVQPSRFFIDDDPYHWAEIASGFNRETIISPIHAAMITSAVVNGGNLVEPCLVKSIADMHDTTVYSSDGNRTRQVMSPETCREMMTLMAATISSGTSKRAFKGFRTDRVLSKLALGGKTGSIKNETREWLFDWFVGYGLEKAGPEKLVVAVLVVHDELLRTRAQEYARLALKYYFRRS